MFSAEPELLLADGEVKLLSRVRFFVIPRTTAYQAPPSVESSRQEYKSGLPFPSLEHLPDLGIEPRPPALQEDTLPSESPGKINGLRMACYPFTPFLTAQGLRDMAPPGATPSAHRTLDDCEKTSRRDDHPPAAAPGLGLTVSKALPLTVVT